MGIHIDGLYEVYDIEKITELFLDAFHDYPKMDAIFPDQEKKAAALEATVRFYCTYDMKYGKAYALDDEIKEAVVLAHSDEMHNSFWRHVKAGSYTKKYKAAMNRLTKEEKKMRLQLFEELDALEAGLDLPEKHLYVDFLGVRTELQGQGRGRRLMKKVCEYADAVKLPIMLFTNTDRDVAFYTSLGFDMTAETRSEKFGFVNWYMVRQVKAFE